jgi:hypothetical protein
VVPLEQLMEPGWMLQRLVRQAERGHRAAHRFMLQVLPGLLDAEERWLVRDIGRLGTLASAGLPLNSTVAGLRVDSPCLLPLTSHLQAHEELRDLLDWQRTLAPDQAASAAVTKLVCTPLSQHLRAERAWLKSLASTVAIPWSSRAQRFLRVAEVLKKFPLGR